MATITGTSAPDLLSGTGAGDTITGLQGDDTLYGYDGADLLDGGSGDDFLYGGSGNDILIGGAGEDFFYGQSGSDTASYATATADLVLDLSDPFLSTGDAEGDFFFSVERFVLGGFSDTFWGSSGTNQAFGGAGSDTLHGLAGNDSLFGENGDDVLVGGAGADILDGGDGIDTASYATSLSALSINLLTGLRTGESVGDTYASIEKLQLTDFNDIVQLSTIITIADGGKGSDTIDGGTGNDTIWGGDGSDNLRGNDGNDTLHAGGTGPEDALVFFARNRLNGGNGNDTLYGDGGRDELYGGSGDDTLEGGTNDDLLSGDSGLDILRGGDGDDILIGGWSADTLVGGSGIDTARYLTKSKVNLADPAAATGEAFGDSFDSIEVIHFLAAESVYVGSTVNMAVMTRGAASTFYAGSGAEAFSVDTEVDGGFYTVTYERAATGVTLTASGEALLGSGAAAGDTIIAATTIALSKFADTIDLRGFAATDLRINAGSGNDTFLLQNDAALTIDGGAGSETITGSLGLGTIDTGAGWDKIDLVGLSGYISSTGVVVDSGTESDTITLSDYDYVTVRAGDGNDVVVAMASISHAGATVDGGAGNDTITLDAGSPNGAVAIVQGGAGRDLIEVRNYTLVTNLDGGDGDDTLIGTGNQQYTISGGAGNDAITASNVLGTVLYGGQISGDAGDDTITVTGHGLTIDGGIGADSITANLLGFINLSSSVNGGDGNDAITINVISPGSFQGTGTVLIEGGAGNDTITAHDSTGDPSDFAEEQFIFQAGWGADTIDNFNIGDDVLRFLDTTTIGLDDFSDLALSGDVDHAVIAYGGNSVTLSGVDVAALSSSDFLFA